MAGQGRNTKGVQGKDVNWSVALSTHLQSGEGQCVEDLDRDACTLHQSQIGVIDAIAAIRIIGSALSFMGAISIISLTIIKKQIFSSKVHPIFVLSIADLLLSALWMIGSGVWLYGLKQQVWCFAISLPTVILECVTVNLTLVYALLAYSGIKKRNLNFLLRSNHGPLSDRVWRPVLTTVVYLTAWLLPTVIVLLVFGVLAGYFHLVSSANQCSCWCLPVYGNVLPLANATPMDDATSHYVYDVNILLVSNGVVLGTHHLVVFILLVVIYSKLLQYIKKIRCEYEQSLPRSSSHDPGMLLITGQSRAKRRIFAFLTVFLMTGVINLFLSLLYLIIDGIALPPGPSNLHYTESQLALLYLVLVIHSLIVPLQGFFNAIVYGWTREDFVHLVAIGNSHFDGWDLDHSLKEENSDYKSLNSSVTKCDDSNITLNEPN